MSLSHRCCSSLQACIPSVPSVSQSTALLWGQNPLKVPLLCGFKRLTSVPLTSPPGGGARDGEGAEPSEGEENGDDWNVVYKAPCGRSLRNHDDVMSFLLATESYDTLQVG